MFLRLIKQLLLSTLAAYGVLWTLVSSFSFFLPDNQLGGVAEYSLLIGLSIVYGLYKSWPRGEIKISLSGSDSFFCIKFGNLFEQQDCLVIHSNEFFDSLLGDHVSPKSVHGQFIRDVLGGQSNAFNQLIEKALKDVEPIENVLRQSGNTKRYKIGTTTSIDINGRRYLLCAHSKTDIETLKASASFQDLWDSLAGIWDAVRIYGNGEDVSMPLIGSGLSSVRLPSEKLIEVILISYLHYNKQNKIPNKVTLVLPPRLKKTISLSSIKQYWESV